jgi:Phosphate/sulphate permeases
MTVVLVALAFSFAWSIGSHYTGACMGMPVALGAVRARTALLLMAPLALLGAATASGKVATTVGTKLVDATPTKLGEIVVVAVAFAITAAYNRLRIPTSTIQLLVGAVVGVAVGASVGVHWRTIATLAVIWVPLRSSPRCSGSPAGRRWAA